VGTYGFSLATNDEGHRTKRSRAHGTNHNRLVARLVRDLAKAVGIAWLSNLTIDFNGVTYVDKFGLAMLVEIPKAARTQGRSLSPVSWNSFPSSLLAW
jgi:ABC-type transporter Mla MlaB component